MSDFIDLHRKTFDFKQFILSALSEDVGDGDHTSLSTIPEKQQGRMQLLVKDEGIIAGVSAAIEVFKIIDKNIRVKVFVQDGEKVKKGTVVFEVRGNARKLLLAERLVLNIMQRMSGIATKTHVLQKLCKGTKARVIDTRKTTPGFRFFEKWAVLIGGAANHRFGLYDMILIKDNHIDFAGGIPEAIDAAKSYLKRTKRKLSIEIETREVADVQKVLFHEGVDRIMLDNFSLMDTRRAVKLVKGRYELESSGGINEKNIKAYAQCGVDFISIGALTHHVEGLDLSLKALK